MSIYPVILSGGSGSRLWPLSREARPKQFLPLVGERSMLQETAQRVSDAAFAAPMVICAEDHRFLVAEHLLEMGIAPFDIVLEPQGRNTAAAVAVAALRVAEEDENAVLLILPADHHIGDVKNFKAAVHSAAAAAAAGRLATFGICPDHPHTGFGYIKQAEPLAGLDGVHRLDRFVEKPDQARAEDMLAEGGWLWNSGIFVFPVQGILAELQAHAPEILKQCRAAVAAGRRDMDFLRLDADAFAAAPSQPIDIAVMEKTAHACVVPVTMDWSDIGSWRALWDIATKDGDGNVTIGDVVGVDVQHSYVRSNGALVVGIGIEDLIVIADDDVVLVADKNRAEEVKDIVARLKSEGWTHAHEHPLVYRPWGTFRSIDLGGRFHVKRITVKPGGTLSLQRHKHRAEHWVVVSGTARVTRGDEVMDITHDQSTYIPMGEIHRLQNPGAEPLELIEVQTGDYLGEDDIERLEDDYGRNES